MEQHPIPQDITGFKFKLVGDMTLQQFGYLATGAILAYLSFASRFPFLIKWSLCFLFGFGGFALAFMPIEERPLDRWIISFIKAIYAPTQYLWQKKEKLPDFFETHYLSTVKTPSAIISAYNDSQAKLEDYLKALPKTPTSSLDILEQNFLQNLNMLISAKTPVSAIYPEEKISRPFSVSGGMVKPTSSPGLRPPEQKQKAGEKIEIIQPPSGSFAIISGRIVKMEPSIKPPPYVHKWTKTPPPQKAPTDVVSKLQYQSEVFGKQAENLKMEMEKLKQAQVFTVEDLNKLKELAQRLAEVEKQKNQAQEELVKLKQQLEEQRKAGVKPMVEEFQVKQTPRVKFVPGERAKHAGLPNPPQTPNIVSGLVTDQKGEILPGVIIVVKDIYDNPVRAIKTNKVGQFSISTPLQNGIYNLELEKEGFQFDIIEIEAKGEIIPPVEIKAK